MWLNEKGFTLIEILVTSVILVLLLSGGYALFESGLNIWNKGEERVDLQQNLRIGLEKMVKEIQSGQRLDTSTQVLAGKAYSLDSKNLIFVNYEGKIIWYYLNGKELRRAVNDSTAHNPLANGIDSLKFTYNRTPYESSNLVTIEIAGSDSNGKEYKLKSSAKIRVVP